MLARLLIKYLLCGWRNKYEEKPPNKTIDVEAKSVSGKVPRPGMSSYSNVGQIEMGAILLLDI